MQFRIVVVGEGREKFGHVFLADTGTSNGDITGQTRPINTVGMYFVKSKREKKWGEGGGGRCDTSFN